MKKAFILMLAILLSLSPLAEASSGHEALNQPFLTVDPNAYLREDVGEYPKTLIRGNPTHDTNELLARLLGDGYIRKERSEWSTSTDYVQMETMNPWETRTVHVYDDGSIWYYDPGVSGERGGEYEPPRMNMLPSESVLLLQGHLETIFTNGEAEHVGRARLISDRWSFADRWMTDAEYRDFMYECDLHYFTFEHRSSSGLSILGDCIGASIGVNGLNGFDLSWHDFTESTETLAPMSLENAVRMANSTRSAHATVLYADLVYSNWVTENEEYNLSWYLVTDRGSYVVDCVLEKHKCDSYEY